MNSKKIEMNSIIKLKNDLERCENIGTEIPDNDRTPSWDGSISLYNTPNLDKKNIQGIIPVQVKGKEVNQNQIRKHEISFPAEVADLRNFRRRGGTIFFVVYMLNYDNYRIFYNSLLPLDLEEILKNIPEKQKTKNIKLIEFPKNDINLITCILSNFIQDSNKQHSTAKTGFIDFDDVGLAKFDNFTFSTTIFEDGPFDYMFRYPVYIYGRKEGFDLHIPINKVIIGSLTTSNIKKQVTIDDEIFYEEISAEKSHENLKIKFGAGFEIDTNKKKLNYEERGNLAERIHDFKFWIEMHKGKTIKIGNITEIKDYKIERGSLKRFQEGLVFYNNLQNLMTKLNVKDDINIDALNEDNLKRIQIFASAIMRGTSVYLNDEREEVLLAKWQFSNLSFAIFGKKINGKEYTIKSLFDEEVSQSQCSIRNDEVEGIPSCIYVMLKRNDFIELSNICYVIMTKTLLSVPYSKEYGGALNFLVLEMIFAFDEMKTKNTELINSIITVSQWLSCQENDNYIYKLNYLQAIKRIRILNMDEFNAIYKIREDEIIKGDSCNLFILCGISILLENKADFNHYFKKMKKEEQEAFIQFPIYTLIKD